MPSPSPRRCFKVSDGRVPAQCAASIDWASLSRFDGHSVQRSWVGGFRRCVSPKASRIRFLPLKVRLRRGVLHAACTGIWSTQAGTGAVDSVRSFLSKASSTARDIRNTIW